MCDEKIQISIQIRQIEDDTYYATSKQLTGLHVECESIDEIFQEAGSLAQDLISIDEGSPYYNKNVIFDFEMV